MIARAAWLGLALAAGGCNQVFGLDPAVRTDADPNLDAAPWLGWGPPTLVAAVSSGANEDRPSLTPDNLELFLSRYASTPRHIYESMRPDPGSPFTMMPSLVADLTSTSDDRAPLFAQFGSGLVGYFATTRTGAGDIYASMRANGGFTWTTPVPVTDLNTFAIESGAAPCQAGSHFVVSSTRDSPDSELYDTALGVPMRITATSSAAQETSPFVTEDCSTLYFASDVAGKFDLYVTTRDSRGEWQAPQKLDASTEANDLDPWVSADGKHLLFASDAAGNYDIYESFRD